MNITKNTVVSLRYTLTDAKGKLRDSSTVDYLHGGYDNLFAKVESALEGHTVGYAVTVDLTVEDGFGSRDENLVRTIPKSEYPAGVKVGGTLERVDDDGEASVFRVIKIKGPVVHLDGNHPLAGEALRFACNVTGVRQATAEEVAHGHVHGDDDSHH